MHIRSTSDIPPRWDIRSSYISLNWNDMQGIADMNKLYEMAVGKRNFTKGSLVAEVMR